MKHLTLISSTSIVGIRDVAVRAWPIRLPKARLWHWSKDLPAVPLRNSHLVLLQPRMHSKHIAILQPNNEVPDRRHDAITKLFLGFAVMIVASRNGQDRRIQQWPRSADSPLANPTVQVGPCSRCQANVAMTMAAFHKFHRTNTWALSPRDEQRKWEMCPLSDRSQSQSSYFLTPQDDPRKNNGSTSARSCSACCPADASDNRL